MVDRSQERRLFIAPDAISVSITPGRNIGVRLGKPHPSLGFTADIVLAMELSPSEARGFAEMLTRKAREAEAGSSQQH